MKVYAPMFPEAKGIFVHGCIVRGKGSSFRAKAHAHNIRMSEFFGWICVRSMQVERLGHFVFNDSRDGFEAELIKPSRVMWHEYAHILTPNHGHDDAWRRTMKRLKQPIPSRYHKRTRT